MEKTRNSVIDLFKDLFKNFGLVISQLVNAGVVDDAQLTGELAKDPMKALAEYEASVNYVEEPVHARPHNRQKVQTRKAFAVQSPTRATEPTKKTGYDDGREI